MTRGSSDELLELRRCLAMALEDFFIFRLDDSFDELDDDESLLELSELLELELELDCIFLRLRMASACACSLALLPPPPVQDWLSIFALRDADVSIFS